MHNQPNIFEVTTLIIGDVDTSDERDIIMKIKAGYLQRIDEFHANYFAYHIPYYFLMENMSTC